MVVLRSADMSEVHAAQDGKEWVSDAKFSPDGATLAFGAHDQTVYLYSVPGFKLRQKVKKSSSAITHIDFSADSKVFQVA